MELVTTTLVKVGHKDFWVGLSKGSIPKSLAVKFKDLCSTKLKTTNPQKGITYFCLSPARTMFWDLLSEPTSAKSEIRYLVKYHNESDWQTDSQFS